MPDVSAHSAPGAGFAPVAALMGDPARAAMLTALLEDRALAAGELANLSGIPEVLLVTGGQPGAGPGSGGGQHLAW